VAVTAVVKTFVEGHEVDTFAATVEFENGVVGTLEASRLARGWINHNAFEVNGSQIVRSAESGKREEITYRGVEG
jgi:predicted dehydrogenase